MTRVQLIAAVIALAALVAGCGARGPLEPPPGDAPEPSPPPVIDGLV